MNLQKTIKSATLLAVSTKTIKRTPHLSGQKQKYVNIYLDLDMACKSSFYEKRD